MNRESMQRLRLDRRLARRSGWISPEELARELESLPDVSHKVARQSEAGDGGGESPAPSTAGSAGAPTGEDEPPPSR